MWKANKLNKKKERKVLRIPEDTKPYLKAIQIK